MNQKDSGFRHFKRINPQHSLGARAFSFCISIVAAMLAAFLAVTPDKVWANGQEYLSIDTQEIYKGMDQSYSQGYQPHVTGNQMRLTIPFLGEEALLNNRINVGLLFPTANGPFLFRNYQQRVTCGKNNLYLFDCNIALDPQRVNGKYPITVLASGKTMQGKYFEYKIDIYVEITDGKTAGQNNTYPLTDSMSPDPNNRENNNKNSGSDPKEELAGRMDSETAFPTAPQETEPVENDSEAISHQPRIRMTKNSLMGQELMAGETYDFTVKFKNEGTSGSMKNVKITLSTEATGIDFEETGWYYDEITSEKTIEISQQIMIQKKSPHGNAALEFMVEYEDAKGTAFTASEKTKLFIKQTARAYLNASPFPQKISSTETISLNLQVQNYGLSPIYNVKVTVEGAGLFPTKELFFGSVESGTAVEGELPVYAGMKNMGPDGETTDAEPYGRTEGIIRFTYEDENKTVTEEVIPVKTNITRPKRVNKKKELQDAKSTQWVYAVYAGSLILTLLIAVSSFIRLLHYKKQLSMD